MESLILMGQALFTGGLAAWIGVGVAENIRFPSVNGDLVAMVMRMDRVREEFRFWKTERRKGVTDRSATPSIRRARAAQSDPARLSSQAVTGTATAAAAVTAAPRVLTRERAPRSMSRLRVPFSGWRSRYTVLGAFATATAAATVLIAFFMFSSPE